MTDRIVEKQVVTDGGGTGAVTAVAVVMVVVALLAVLFFAGAFDRMFGDRDTNIDINIKKPSAVFVLPR